MLDLDPARHFVEPDLDPKMFDIDGIPERILLNVDFEKNQLMTKRHAKFPMMHHAKSVRLLSCLVSIMIFIIFSFYGGLFIVLSWPIF